MDILKTFLLTFIPLFVAIDAPGILPLYISFIEGIPHTERKHIARQSVITAFLVAISFLLLGNVIFYLLGINLEDFMIAGGILLLILSISDILRVKEREIEMSDTLGVVPIGTPLLAGPATLTTVIILSGTHGYPIVIFSLFLNLLIAWIILDKADFVIKIMGIYGIKAFAKVMALLLSAIAISLIKRGLIKILGVS
ncbi:MAG TPA: MarC family protein [Thermodesulfovibrio thiophilus]|uniref:MarC family protein n=1 Tax=Thermodesulfovibrio thiophilus TaxID=340095 RepID=UPI0017FF7F30|nr:MarC family protein [Thermodesulfovibrio thiophilus]HHW19829.1 MarC family protein [Thermodesulfovibrio thiophilus]HQD35564.1 MarC family protein [Thermodesulfovibrio thiophilus]